MRNLPEHHRADRDRADMTGGDIERAAKASENGGAESGAPGAQNAAQGARAAKGGDSHKAGETPVGSSTRATLRATQLLAIK